MFFHGGGFVDRRPRIAPRAAAPSSRAGIDLPVSRSITASRPSTPSPPRPTIARRRRGGSRRARTSSAVKVTGLITDRRQRRRQPDDRHRPGAGRDARRRCRWCCRCRSIRSPSRVEQTSQRTESFGEGLPADRADDGVLRRQPTRADAERPAHLPDPARRPRGHSADGGDHRRASTRCAIPGATMPRT